MRARFVLLFVWIFSLAACSAGGGTTSLGGGGGRDGGGGGGSMDAGSGGGGPGVDPTGMGEPCNGIDDDGDGVIDEACACSPGATQPCWPGAELRRKVGACRDGVQQCVPFGEFYAWGNCVGFSLPGPEIERDGIDQDCDGNDAGGSTPCLPSEFGESCGDGTDQDCDGLVDCADPDCGCCVPAGGEVCDNGVDDDCDGLVDCADDGCAAACAPATPPPPAGCTPEFPFIIEIACGDGRDNDCDGRFDCDDPDCRSPGACGCATTETNCSDRHDDDCDHATDCVDTDCQRCAAGTSRWCDDPVYCHWGTQECQPDGHWGACTEVTERPGGCGGLAYSTTCCVDAGGCCENYPGDRTSVGACTGVGGCGPM